MYDGECVEDSSWGPLNKLTYVGSRSRHFTFNVLDYRYLLYYVLDVSSIRSPFQSKRLPRLLPSPLFSLVRRTKTVVETKTGTKGDCQVTRFTRSMGLYSREVVKRKKERRKSVERKKIKGKTESNKEETRRRKERLFYTPSNSVSGVSKVKIKGSFY